MLISVIIPVYNVEDYLFECVQSVLNQTYENFEILLINDGSTDNSVLICDDFAKSDKRVKVFHQQNKGVSSARNLGIRNFSGDYVYFLDSDDTITPGFFNYVVGILQKNNSDILFFSLNNNNQTESLNNYNQKEALLLLLNSKLPSSLWLGIYHFKLFTLNYLSTGIHFYEDLEYQFRLIGKANKITHSKLSFHTYNIRSGSANNLLRINEKVLTCLKIKDSLLISKVISKKEIFDLHSIFILQCVFYALKSDILEAKIACKIQKELRANLKEILISRKLSFLYKLLACSFAVSSSFSFSAYNSLYKKYIYKRISYAS